MSISEHFSGLIFACDKGFHCLFLDARSSCEQREDLADGRAIDQSLSPESSALAARSVPEAATGCRSTARLAARPIEVADQWTER